MIDIELDRVEHHGIEQHPGDLGGRRWSVAPRRWIDRPPGGAGADGDEALGAEMNRGTQRAGVADAPVAEIAAVDLDSREEDGNRTRCHQVVDPYIRALDPPPPALPFPDLLARLKKDDTLGRVEIGGGQSEGIERAVLDVRCNPAHRNAPLQQPAQRRSIEQ